VSDEVTHLILANSRSVASTRGETRIGVCTAIDTDDFVTASLPTAVG
jgi:hypothetical protein